MTRIFKFTSSMIFCCILHTAITFAELQATGETSREKARDGIIHIEKDLLLDIR